MFRVVLPIDRLAGRRVNHPSPADALPSGPAVGALKSGREAFVPFAEFERSGHVLGVNLQGELRAVQSFASSNPNSFRFFSPTILQRETRNLPSEPMGIATMSRAVNSAIKIW